MDYELKNIVDRVMNEAKSALDIHRFDLDRSIAKHGAAVAALPDGRQRLSYIVEQVNNGVDEYIRGGLPKGADQHYAFSLANPPDRNSQIMFKAGASLRAHPDFSRAPIDNLARSPQLQKVARFITNDCKFPIETKETNVNELSNATRYDLFKTAEHRLREVRSELKMLELELNKVAEDNIGTLSNMIVDMTKKGYKLEDLYKAAWNNTSKDDRPEVRSIFLDAAERAQGKIPAFLKTATTQVLLDKSGEYVADYNHPFFQCFTNILALKPQLIKAAQAEEELMGRIDTLREAWVAEQKANAK
jgi:hypothetical protein